MAWIEVHDTLREHHKTYALASKLKIDQYAAVGVVVSLWTWAINNAQDGDLSRFPAAAIANACHWQKKGDLLVNALQECGFVTRDMQLHDWDDYAGRLLERRELNREQSRVRQQKRRERVSSLNSDESRVSNADVTRDITEESRVSLSPTVPNLTVPNQTVPIEVLPDGNTHICTDDDPAPTKRGPSLATRFDALWAIYPKRQGKARAFESYKRAIRDGETDENIADGIRKYIEQLDSKRTDPQYIKHGATYFSQRAWQDDFKVVNGSAAEKVYEDFTGW